MIKRHGILVMTMALLFFSVGTTGCRKEETPKEKKTIEKLKSDDADERMNGLVEANEKFGKKE